jgi:hypothetical protein
MAADDIFVRVDEPALGSIQFHIGMLEMLRLDPNGDIFVRGQLAENDKAVVYGLRDFLSGVRPTSDAMTKLQSWLVDNCPGQFDVSTADSVAAAMISLAGTWRDRGPLL